MSAPEPVEEHVTALDDQIATYLAAIEVEGKTAKTQASYANSLADFRAVGRRLGLPEARRRPTAWSTSTPSSPSCAGAARRPATSTVATAR